MTNMRILIKNGQVIDPGQINNKADVLVEDGKIQAVGSDLQVSLKNSKSITTINANGMIVCPGFIDLHVHLREPGFEHKETIATGVNSAVAGGFTTVCCMPNTSPVNDSQAITEFILRQAKIANKARVFPIGAITKGSKGEELAEIGELHEAGCVAISDDGIPVMNSLVMRRAMEYARTFDLPVIDHCEDLHLSADGSMNEGFVSTELGIPGIPNAAEEVMVARNIFLAELTQSRLHLPHVSTIGSVRLLQQAKERGVNVTAEASPHHFTLTEEAVRSFDTHTKMNPPLRTDADVQAVKKALKDGIIDIIATDHAPHAAYEKQRQFDNAPFGIIGLETALPLTLNLVDEGVLTLEEAISKLTREPARVFSLPYGTLAIGAEADITLIDTKKNWQLDPNRLHSKSRNTPFSGWMLKGRVAKTIVGGQIVYEDN